MDSDFSIKFNISSSEYIHIFKKIIETIHSYSDILHFKINKTDKNIILQTTDNANISIFNIILHSNYFADSFIYLSNNDFITFSIYLKDLNKIFKIIKKNTIIYFSINNNQTTLNISTENNNIFKKFQICLLDNTYYEWINIYTLNNNYDLSLNILSNDLINIFSELYTFDTNLNIIKYSDSNDISFITSDTSESIYSKYKLNIDNNIIKSSSNTINISVSLSYLNNFKLFHNFKNTLLNLSNDKPLYIYLNENNLIDIYFMIAPKIDI